MKNLSYLLALHSVEGLGSKRLELLIKYFKDPKLIWSVNLKDLGQLGLPAKVLDSLSKRKTELDPEQYYQELMDKGIKVLTLFEKDYPKALSEIPDAPLILYYKGEIKPKDSLALGVVGTRKVTSYGRLVTQQFTSDLVEANFTIVSGLARGVDTVAHKTTLDKGGRTIAVLGGGLNQIFPPENVKLSLEICQGQGAVVTEFPPDYPHLAGNFPGRNRIISGLSKGVLVTEAAEDSGSLITARFAASQGREVFAVPGPITSSLSEGPFSLIKDGAKLVYKAQDILEELGLGDIKRVDPETIQFSDEERLILNVLQNETKHIDEICRQLQKAPALISSCLIRLEIKGVLKSLGGGNYTSLLRE